MVDASCLLSGKINRCNYYSLNKLWKRYFWIFPEREQIALNIGNKFLRKFSLSTKLREKNNLLVWWGEGGHCVVWGIWHTEFSNWWGFHNEMTAIPNMFMKARFVVMHIYKNSIFSINRTDATPFHIPTISNIYYLIGNWHH